MRHLNITTSLVIAGLAAAGLAVTGCGGGSPATSAAGRPATSGPGQASPPGRASPPGQAEGQQNGPPDRGLAGVHACRLIPATMIAQTLGQLDEPPSESASGLTCFYNTRTSDGNGGTTYILDVLRRSAYQAAKTIAQSEASAGLTRLVSVNGIGDEGFAQSNDTGGPVYTVYVAKGGTGASIQMDSVDPGDVRRADHLVAAAIARL